MTPSLAQLVVSPHQLRASKHVQRDQSKRCQDMPPALQSTFSTHARSRGDQTCLTVGPETLQLRSPAPLSKECQCLVHSVHLLARAY